MSLFPQNVLDHAQKAAVVEHRLDFERILALPRRAPIDCERDEAGRYGAEAQALAEYVSEQYALAPRAKCACTSLGYSFCIKTLNPAQAWALREVRRLGGAVGLLGVGSGKTLLSILAALAVADCKVAVLLAKPDQRIHYWNAYLRLREHFRVPSFVFDKLDDGYGAIVRGAGVPVLHFVPYSLLQNQKSTLLLEMMKPDLIICDEAHSVSAKTSTRTNRLIKYMERNDHVRFCAWSGTLVKKSVKDQAHLMGFALGVGSPMPIDEDDVEAWAGVLDPSPLPDTETVTAQKLYRAFDRIPERRSLGRTAPNAGVWEGYRDHVLFTPGVVSTRESSVGCSLPFHARKIELPPEVKKALADVRTLMKRPDGEELVEATEIAACARNVADGFYFYWAFPGIPCTCPENVFVDEQRCEHCQFINEWYKRRSAYYSELRGRLVRFEPHLDSPKLCFNAAERAYRGCSCGHLERPPGGQVRRHMKAGGAMCELPMWSSEEWPAWVAIKDDVEYAPRVKWISEFFAADAAEWAREHRGIVWTQSSAFGRKIAELAGVNYHGGGPSAEATILAERGDRSIVASIKAHGTGRDGLQHKFREQYFAEPMASGDQWQQGLGRLARPGQEADSVESWVAWHSDEVRDALRNAIRDAEFTESMTGNKQLLLSADFSFDWRRA